MQADFYQFGVLVKAQLTHVLGYHLFEVAVEVDVSCGVVNQPISTCV